MYLLIEVKKTSEVRLESGDWATVLQWWVKVDESEQVKRQLKGVPLAQNMKFCQMQVAVAGILGG